MGGVGARQSIGVYVYGLFMASYDRAGHVEHDRGFIFETRYIEHDTEDVIYLKSAVSIHRPRWWATAPLQPQCRQNKHTKQGHTVSHANFPDAILAEITHFQTSFPPVPIGSQSFLRLLTTQQNMYNTIEG